MKTYKQIIEEEIQRVAKLRYSKAKNERERHYWKMIINDLARDFRQYIREQQLKEYRKSYIPSIEEILKWFFEEF